MIALSLVRFSLLLFMVFVIVESMHNEEELGSYHMKYSQLANSDVRNIKKVLKNFELFGLDKKFEEYLRDLKDYDHNLVDLFTLQANLSSKCKISLFNLVKPILHYLSDTKKLLSSFLGSPLAHYLDAWAKPTTRILMGHAKWSGAFDECNNINGAHYCLADMVLLEQKTPAGQFGTCVPKECNATDVLALLHITNLKLNDVVDFPANGSFFENYGAPVLCNDERSLPTDTIVLIVICSILVFLCFLGTIIEWLQDCFTPDRLIPTHSLYDQHNIDDTIDDGVRNHDPPIIISNSAEDLSYARFGTDVTNITFKRGNTITNFFICFSVLKNTKALLNTTVSKGTITSINGIRAISMTWVILGHIYFFGVYTSPDNITASLKISQRFSYQAIANAYVSVDSFFFLSGFLVAYITLKKMDNANGKFNFFKFVLHRFIRLTPSYAFAIFVYTSLYPQMLNSPEGLVVRAGSDQCNKYWWTNLLYINNFYPQAFFSECLGWSWYLANDMQFYIISPIFLLAMYHFNLIGALISTVVGVVICVATTMAIMAAKGLPSLLTEAWLPIVPLERRNKVGIYGDDVYIKPYTRIAPYLVGLFWGFILSRKIFLTRKPNFFVTLIGWVVATGMGFAVVYSPYSEFKEGGTLWGTVQNVLFASLSRLTWALALGWVVYACQYKKGGIVNHFLSWSLWIPLSRLTYGAYLFHPIVLNYYYKTMDNPWHFQDDTTIFRFLSVTVVSYALAFISALLIDLPVYNLERRIMK